MAGSEERRRNALTEEDLQNIASLITEKSPKCAFGFDQEQVSTLKNFVVIYKRTVNVVGTVIVGSIVTGLLVLLSKGFWIALFEGVTKK